jgi:hypothetical protein
MGIFWVGGVDIRVTARNGTKMWAGRPNGCAPPTMLLAAAVRRQVLLRSLRCIVDGVHLVVGRHMRLIRRRQNIFHLVKLGCFAVVPCCVLMVFCRTFMEFAQR